MCVVQMQGATIFGLFNVMIVLQHFPISTQRKKHLKLGTHAHQKKEVGRSENDSIFYFDLFDVGDYILVF